MQGGPEAPKILTLGGTLMNVKFFSLFLLCAIMILFTGCRIGTVYNVEDTPINTGSGKEPTLEEVEKAILSAATNSKPAWSMRVQKPGHIVASLHVRSHTAVVDIAYSTKSYSITYNTSTNLKYDAEEKTIHSNYNGWIQNLDTAIKGKLSAL